MKAQQAKRQTAEIPVCGGTPSVNMPTTIASLQEIEKFVSVLEDRIASMRYLLFSDGEIAKSVASPSAGSIHGLIGDVSQRIASLCGDVATINQRLGIPQE
jgi:hypothetical protein